MPVDAVALDAWCQSYVEAFSAFDATAISAHWAFPALILTGGRRLSLPDRSAFDANTERLLDFYRQQAVARAVRRLEAVFPMGDGQAAIRVEDQMLDAQDAPITGWTASYCLVKTDQGWRACLASADGELAAWAARGTPLGARRRPD